MVNLPPSDKFQAGQSDDGLQPAEALFDFLATALAELIAPARDLSRNTIEFCSGLLDGLLLCGSRTELLELDPDRAVGSCLGFQ